MNNYKNLNYITFWYFLAVCNLSLFLYNFMPVKNKSNVVVVDPPKYLNNISLGVQNHYKAQVDKIILVVIDALRYDFITKQYMPYIFSEINDLKGCLLPAHAEAPTVTMPRLKAMTTGSVPQFIDVILNFASKQITDDSFLHRARAEGKKIIFYGDNTWLKLFPKMFLRSEGTNSFYVTDFTEVDNNVTRHLETELKSNDWDIMILHYLGLDHIGHVHGPFHPLIGQKLQEMDEIINNIHTAVFQQDKKTIILVCGDHGMRDEGGHGGSSEPETLIPLIFLNKPCCYKKNSKVSQSDIAPTLSTIMGFKLPADNIGKIIPDIMNISDENLLYLLHYNALNLLQKNPTHFHEFQDIFDRHAYYLKYYSTGAEILIEDYENKITEISNELIKSSSFQNVPILYLSFAALIIILFGLLLFKYQVLFIRLSVITIIVTCVACYLDNNFVIPYVSYIYFGGILSIISLYVPKLISLIPVSSNILLFFFFATILQILLLIASSFIEQEEQIWYYIFGTALLLESYKNAKSKKWISLFLWILLFVGLRILRNFVFIARFLNLQQNSLWMSIVFMIALTAVAKSCGRINNSDKVLNILTISTTATIFWYRNSLYYDKHTVFEARLALILSLVTGALNYIKLKEIFKSLSVIWILYISLLMRPNYVILIPICYGASEILFNLVSSTKILMFLHYWLGIVLFHCQGFSNSLSSLDISPGYVGLTQYSLFLTSFQIICHTYTFQILSMLLLFSKINFTKQVKVLHSVIFFRIFTLVWYSFCMLLHRQHLFIWSVFAPKLIIESCHSAILFIVLLLYLAIVICIKNK